jgi:hypothetical protein
VILPFGEDVMEIIASKKGSILPLYIFVAAIGILFLCIGIAIGEFYYIGAGALIFIVGMAITLDFCRFPMTLITLGSDGMLYLPRSVTVNPREITDVSYRRASARSIQYKWGTVIITTYSDTYKLRYTADCESVSKRLTELMYESKQTI